MEKSSERLSRLLSMNAEDRFEGKRTFFEKFLFHVFRNWIKHFLDFRPEQFGKVAELTLEEPRRTFWEQCFFLKKNLLFQTLRQKCSEKGKICRLWSLKCILRDQKNNLRKIFWVLRTYSVIFGLLAKTIQSVCQNCFQWFNEPWGSFWKKNLYFRHRCFFFRDFWTYSQHFQSFGSQGLVWCVKTTFYVSKEALFWSRTIFVKTDSFSIHIRTLN